MGGGLETGLCHRFRTVVAMVRIKLCEHSLKSGQQEGGIRWVFTCSQWRVIVALNGQLCAIAWSAFSLRFVPSRAKSLELDSQ